MFFTKIPASTAPSHPKRSFLRVLVVLWFLSALTFGVIVNHPEYVDSGFSSSFDANNYYAPVIPKSAHVVAATSTKPTPDNLAPDTNLTADVEKQRNEILQEILRKTARPIPTPSSDKNLNDHFTLGGITYAVESATVDTGYNVGTQDDGGKYILIFFKCENNGINETPLIASIYLQDALGRRYKLPESYIGVSDKSGYQEYYYSQYGHPTLRPGLSQKYYVEIEVAATSKALVAHFADQGGQEYTVDLPL